MAFKDTNSGLDVYLIKLFPFPLRVVNALQFYHINLSIHLEHAETDGSLRKIFLELVFPVEYTILLDHALITIPIRYDVVE